MCAGAMDSGTIRRGARAHETFPTAPASLCTQPQNVKFLLRAARHSRPTFRGLFRASLLIWAIRRLLYRGWRRTLHRLYPGDARKMPALGDGSVHLVLTSPPYWTLKEYRDSEAQLGHIEDYDRFLHELDKVWKRCFDALVPGGRLICVVGD